MRQPFAHQALVELLDGSDERAPGAAVTVALCGHWDHEPPCQVPHRSDVTTTDGGLAVRVLFAADPADEGGVRARVAQALAAGELSVPPPQGAPPTRWRLVRSGPAELSDADRRVAARWVGAG